MPKIAALRQDARRPERYHLELDDDRALTLDESLVASERLAPGLTLDETAITRLQTLEEERALVDRAARYLANRPRSRTEVRRRLLRVQPGKTPPTAAAIERALERLDALGYLDDAVFASYWTEQRDRFSPRSARAIRQELRQRGVDAETAGASATPDDDEERAVAAGRKRLRALASADPRDFALRMGGFLQRRGFGYGVTRAAIRRLWEEAQAERGAGVDDALPVALAALDDGESGPEASREPDDSW
ncbi:MAG TPA: regulatory protein RecX [Ktedonobacterales bacterium]